MYNNFYITTISIDGLTYLYQDNRTTIPAANMNCISKGRVMRERKLSLFSLGILLRQKGNVKLITVTFKAFKN